MKRAKNGAKNKLTYILKKIKLITRSMSNPPFFLYLMFHYFKTYMPVQLARRIARANYKKQDGKFLIVNTYDGSGQLVHPDVTASDDVLYFIATPYPYGMEEYENPCVYYGREIYSLEELCQNPIDKQEKHDYGYHLSDPCVLFNDNCLYCFFRTSKRIEKRNYNSVQVIRIDAKNKRILDKKVIIPDTEDLLLSPAIITDNLNNYFLYYVSENGGLILCTYTENFECEYQVEQTVLGMPNNYKLWHISIVYSKNKDKHAATDCRLEGLFLLTDDQKSQFTLYKAYCPCPGAAWNIGEQFPIGKSTLKEMLFPYKSSFVPGTSQIILSYRDTKNRYRLEIV